MRQPLRLLITACACFADACRGGAAQGEAQTQAVSSPPVAAAATVPHGNHDPRYGGIVLMNGDLHFEVVLRRDGRYQVYFSDAIREELPASIASRVSVTVNRAGTTPETVLLQIDESGESWIGRGRPVDDPARATARIAYAAQDAPYWIDVPFTTAAGEAR
jgi:hypothetical protein